MLSMTSFAEAILGPFVLLTPAARKSDENREKMQDVNRANEINSNSCSIEMHLVSIPQAALI